jgi:hypothetical protein
MRTYIVSFYQIAKNLLPHFLQRKAVLGWITEAGLFWVTATGESWVTGSAARHLAWLRALMAPMESLNAIFAAYVDDVRYRLSITGQVIYLEHYLNDLYDPLDRRIYISDGSPLLLFLFNKADGQDAFVIYNKSESQTPVYLPNKEDTENNVDFIINIPYNSTTTPILLDKIRASTNVYKPAGRRYRIDDDPTGPIWSE